MVKKALIFLAVIGALFLFVDKVVNRKYTNSDFGIKTYVSSYDKDNDLIDDQTDILENAKKYISYRPKYKSKYYESGYPNDEYGVCTDLVAFALKNAGYDLMELVYADICENKERYHIDVIDKNIDFRRVKNLAVYFKYNSIALTCDLAKIEEWQGGDIVVFKDHIGIISDKKNKKGIPLLIHHANALQINYEEDVLEFYGQDQIKGHYRIS